MRKDCTSRYQDSFFMRTRKDSRPPCFPRAALAAREQGKHQAFHEAMLASETELTQEEVFAIAQRIGLDVKKLESDLQAPEWQAAIDRNHALATLLGISGTPGFVIDSELHPGTLELTGLKALVAKARTKR
jgi:2-hydroxychromene-2-carboxylate isomerase